MMKAILGWIMAGSLIAPGAAQASVIYDNAGAPVDFIIDSDPGGNNGFVILADDFTLASGQNVIRDIHWTGTHNPTGSFDSYTENFTIEFFADSFGSPALAPFLSLAIGDVTGTDTGTDIFGRDLRQYSVNITPLTLVAGTAFWLSIFNDTTADSGDGWTWGSIAGSGNLKVRDSHTSAWNDVGPYRVDFQLTDDIVAVPEPATFGLLGIGLAGLAARRRRQAR